MSMREYIQKIENVGQISRIRKSVSTQYQIAALTAQAQGGNALLFENVQDSKYQVVTNMVGTKDRFASALGCRPQAIHDTILAAIDSPHPLTVGPGKFMQNRDKSIDSLPVVTHFEKESGPFIASSVVFAKNPDTGAQNTSFHRMMPVSDRQFTMRLVEGRHLHRCFVDAQDHGEDLRVAIVVGVHPAVLIAGAYQAKWGADEMEIANALLGGGLRMSHMRWSGLQVPSESEIVMEGRILQDQTAPEWMVEMLRTYDHKRYQPVFELETLYHQDRPIFHDILSGYGEHRLLMGMPVESKINGALQGRNGFVTASMSGGGCNWLHAVVQIKKRHQSDPQQIINRTFKAHRSLKMVTVVDDDINPDSAVDVEYAMATRFQADQDVIVIKNVHGSSLDPSSDQENLRTAKMGIDATIPQNKRPEGFELARIPGADKIRLVDYLP